MGRICSCGDANLTTISKLTCPKSFGQIQKLVFTKLSYVSGSSKIKNFFRNDAASTPSGHVSILASWETKLAASDGTKIVVTPYVEAPTQEGGDAITFGGGNDTLGGVEEIVGRNSSKMNFALRKYGQDIISEIKALECEGNLGVYLVGQYDEIEGISGTEEIESAEVPVVYPIPIHSLFVGDKVHGGLQEPDSNALSFNFLPNYSDKLIMVGCEGILTLNQ